MALTDDTKAKLALGGVGTFFFVAYLLGSTAVPEENVLDVYACEPSSFQSRVTATLVPKEFWSAQLLAMQDERKSMRLEDRVLLTREQMEELFKERSLRSGDILWADTLSRCEVEIERRYRLRIKDLVQDRDKQERRRMDMIEKRERERSARN